MKILKTASLELQIEWLKADKAILLKTLKNLLDPKYGDTNGLLAEKEARAVIAQEKNNMYIQTTRSLNMEPKGILVAELDLHELEVQSIADLILQLTEFQVKHKDCEIVQSFCNWDGAKPQAYFRAYRKKTRRGSKN